MAADVTRLITEPGGRRNAGYSSPTADYGSTVSPASSEDNQPTQPVQTTKIYTRRWIMLLIFCSYSFSNGYQWIHLNIIDNVIQKYYSESLPEDEYARETALDWLSLVYLLSYFPFIIPAFWVLDVKGLRFCCVGGSFLNAAAAWIRCGALNPSRFAVLMMSQVLAAIAQLWLLAVPARLSAVWFGMKEIATATAFGVFGNQLGISAGFLIPPIFIHDSGNNTALMEERLTGAYYGVAGVTTLIFLLVAIFFQEKPPVPPSHTQLVACGVHERVSYGESLKQLFKNRGFILLVIAYGLTTGTFYALSTLLNPIILSYFPGDTELAGTLGLTVIIAGVFGSLVAGIWLDKTAAYKGTTIVFFLLALISMGILTATVHLRYTWILYLMAAILGFFMTGYLPIGFQYGAELTYPVSEATSSGLLTGSATMFGLLFTLCFRAVINPFGALYGNICFTLILLIAAILSATLTSDYRRYRAIQAEHLEVNISDEELSVSSTENEDSDSEDKTLIQNVIYHQKIAINPQTNTDA